MVKLESSHQWHATKIEASPAMTFVNNETLLAICGQSGLLVQSLKRKGDIVNRVTLDDAECLDIAWSAQGTFLACIRREGSPLTTVAYLLLMQHRGYQEPDSMQNDSEELPLALTKLQGSEQANMLSFSPSENWLIVGKTAHAGNIVRFCIYNLHESYGPDLSPP